jgi:hypothetical protein
MMMAMPGTMTSGSRFANQALDARSRQIETTEYSSSFFDDYDDEDEEVDSDFDPAEDSDGDFDESTLWEIASLLKTDSVPSKNSLFPVYPPRGMMEETIEEVPSDDDNKSPDLMITIGIEQDQTRDSLWTGPSESNWIGQAKGKGLPNPDDETWSQYNDNSSTARAKPRPAPPAVIESDNLWAAGDAAKKAPESGPMWTGKMSTEDMVKARKIRKRENLGLWDQPAAPEGGEAEGMFQVNSGRVEYRTTTKEPAAQKMVRKARSGSDAKPLEQLNSAKLWNAVPNRQKSRFHKTSHGLWAHPRVPEEHESRGMFTANRQRGNFRTTAAEPAAKNMHRKPRPAELKPLPLLMSSCLWSSSQAMPVHRNWITGKMERSRPAAHKADWEAALHAAVIASYGAPLVRRTASPSEWAAELHEAIALSQRRVFDASTRHPVFAGSSLTTSSQVFHPAAMGYTDSVAAVHPVFFGSGLITCALEVVHPAMAPLLMPVERPHYDVLPEDPAVRAMIQAQIEALEQERMFVENAAREMYRQSTFFEEVPDVTGPAPPMPSLPVPQQQQSQLWLQPSSPSVPSNGAAATGTMWTPDTKPISRPESPPAVPTSEAEDRQLQAMRSIRRKEQRRAEIQARIASIGIKTETAAETPAASFAEQSMWKATAAEEKKEDKALAGTVAAMAEEAAATAKEEAGKKSWFSKVILRY